MGASSPSHIWLKLANTSFSPADNTTYYVGGSVCSPQTVGGVRSTYPNLQGIIESAYFFAVADNAPTNENITLSLRVNDTTDYALDVIACATTMMSRITGLNIPLAATDFIELKIEVPAMVTNPTTWRLSLDLIMRC